MGNFDLDVISIHEVLRRDAEAAGSHLLHRAPTVVVWVGGVVALLVFPTLTRIRFTSKAVHGNGQGLVRLGRDRAVGHSTRGKTSTDVAHWLDVLKSERSGARYEIENPTNRRATLNLLVHRVAVVAKDVVTLGPCRVLQLENRLGVKKMNLAIASPLVLAGIG